MGASESQEIPETETVLSETPGELSSSSIKPRRRKSRSKSRRKSRSKSRRKSRSKSRRK
jgi:hypothetical protein